MAYCFALFLGTLVIVVTHTPLAPTGRYVATRTLDANRLLQPGDLVPAPRGERYLRDRLTVNQVLPAGGTSAMPTPSVRKDTLPVALPVVSQLVLSGAANAGGTVHICQGGKDIADTIAVQAAICPSDGQICIALLDLPVAKAAAVSAAFGAVSVPTIKAFCE